MLLGSSMLCALLSHAGLLFGAWQSFKVLKPRVGGSGGGIGSARGMGGAGAGAGAGASRAAPSSPPSLRRFSSPPLPPASPLHRSSSLAALGSSGAHILAASYDEEAGKAMLAYWAVLSSLAAYEWLGEWALSWLPLYFEAKACVLLWLIAGVAARCMGITRAGAALPRLPGAAARGAGRSSLGGRGTDAVLDRGLNGAVVLFTSLLHPAMHRLDAMLERVVMPRLAEWGARCVRSAGRSGSRACVLAHTVRLPTHPFRAPHFAPSTTNAEPCAACP